MNDLGRRIVAACAYSGLNSTRSLADRIGVQPETLRQIEMGAVNLEQFDIEAIISSVAAATGLPEGFFVADLTQLNDDWEPSHEKLARLEDRMDDLLAKVDGLADRADEQLRIGSERLEQFAEILIRTRRDPSDPQ